MSATMEAFRSFTPAVKIATGTFRSAASANIWQPAHHFSVRGSLHTCNTASGSRRVGASWQTRCWHTRARARHQQQTRSYRRQLFNRSRLVATGTLFRRWAQRPTFYYEVAGIAGVCGAWFVYHLEAVPVSGRVRFNVLSNEREQQLGQHEFQGLLREYSGRILPKSSKEHRMIVRVMERLIPHCGLEGQEWEIQVIKDEQKNAFVLPGGKVFIFTGILDVCKTDDGLAAVLGHEIAHNVAHHAAEQASRSLVLLPIGVVAWLASGVDPELLRLFTSLAFTLPGSRKQEEEADYIGLLMMAESCYDPKAALRLWATMEKEDNGQAPPQFLSTHPSNHDRLEKIQSWLSQAEDKRQRSGCATMTHQAERFREFVDFTRW